MAYGPVCVCAGAGVHVAGARALPRRRLRVAPLQPGALPLCRYRVLPALHPAAANPASQIPKAYGVTVIS